jgi:hypothetical protein
MVLNFIVDLGGQDTYLSSDVAESLALNSVNLTTQMWCCLLLLVGSYCINFGEASIW